MAKPDLTGLKKIHATFTDFMKHNRTMQDQYAILKQFKTCYDVSWKIMKRFLYNDGIEVHTPKHIFIEAERTGLIKDVNLWFDFLENRKEVPNAYDDEVAKTILTIMPKFESELGNLIEVLDKRNK